MRGSPRNPKMTLLNWRSQTRGCGNILIQSDGHNFCVLCLNDTHFRPSHKDQQCPHCSGLNPSSYRDRQRRRKKALAKMESHGKSSEVDWGRGYCILRKHLPSPPVSSSGGSGQGTPLRWSQSSSLLSSGQACGLEISLARVNSLTLEGKSPDFSSASRGQAVMSPSSPPGVILPGVRGAMGSSLALPLWREGLD